jgi:hypothetical protein
MKEYPMARNDDAPDGLQMALQLALDIQGGGEVEYTTVLHREADFKAGAY